MSEVLVEHNKRVAGTSEKIRRVAEEARKVIVGQEYVLDRLLIGLLTGGHLLLEGVPGLAKTLSVMTLSKAVDVSFKRIQFTPDLLPADLVGTLIYDPDKREFQPRLGPVFANFVLADEINRAPAKVQSALLEAMQEKQVTVGDQSYVLPDPFLVLATQNPIEQEGTYPLPEAQVDRFVMKLKVVYPDRAEEKEILDRMVNDEVPEVSKVIGPEDILVLRQAVNTVYVDDKIKEYVLDIVETTRFPERHNLAALRRLIEYGASPRATLWLVRCAKAYAFLNGRGYVLPEDIKAIGPDVLRHRVIPSFEAEAESVTSDTIIERIFNEIEVP